MFVVRPMEACRRTQKLSLQNVYDLAATLTAGTNFHKRKFLLTM